MGPEVVKIDERYANRVTNKEKERRGQNSQLGAPCIWHRACSAWPCSWLWPHAREPRRRRRRIDGRPKGRGAVHPACVRALGDGALLPGRQLLQPLYRPPPLPRRPQQPPCQAPQGHHFPPWPPLQVSSYEFSLIGSVQYWVLILFVFVCDGCVKDLVFFFYNFGMSRLFIVTGKNANICLVAWFFWSFFVCF